MQNREFFPAEGWRSDLYMAILLIKGFFDGRNTSRVSLMVKQRVYRLQSLKFCVKFGQVPFKTNLIMFL